MTTSTSNSRAADLIASLPTDLFIGGQWRAASENQRFGVDNPATGGELTTVADASIGDGDAALSAAVTAQETWGDTPPRERAELQRAAYEDVNERADNIALHRTQERNK